MRSAQSRMGLLSSLASARRDVGRCVDAIPVSVRTLKLGGAAFAGLAGVALLRLIFSSGRRKSTVTPAAPLASASPQRSMGRYLLTESIVVLLLPLCRRLLLRDGPMPSTRLGGIVDNLLKKLR